MIHTRCARNCTVPRASSRLRALCTALAALALLSACSHGSGTTQADDEQQAGEQTYPVTGTIVAIDPETKRWYVDHDEIPGFMDAMVMPFHVPDQRYWTDTLSVGQTISGTLVVGEEGSVLEDIEFLDD